MQHVFDIEVTTDGKMYYAQIGDGVTGEGGTPQVAIETAFYLRRNER